MPTVFRRGNIKHTISKKALKKYAFQTICDKKRETRDSKLDTDSTFSTIFLKQNKSLKSYDVPSEKEPKKCVHFWNQIVLSKCVHQSFFFLQIWSNWANYCTTPFRELKQRTKNSWTVYVLLHLDSLSLSLASTKFNVLHKRIVSQVA